MATPQVGTFALGTRYRHHLAYVTRAVTGSHHAPSVEDLAAVSG